MTDELTETETAVAIVMDRETGKVRDVMPEIRLRHALRRTCAELDSARGHTCGDCDLHVGSDGAMHTGDVGCGGELVRVRHFGGVGDCWWCPKCKIHPSDEGSVTESGWIKLA